jgi:O-acetyl-ADP-ribose deacetylase (regulator of RNase III)
MIVYEYGDIFNSNESAIAHGCNCSGGFGSGFAKEVATRYPAVREAYLLKFRGEGWRLGDVQCVSVGVGENQLTIANCATQQRFGRPDEGPYISYPAVREVIRNLLTIFPYGFAMPKIGAGLAGGNWDIIEKIIEEESAGAEIKVYVVTKVIIKGQP